MAPYYKLLIMVIPVIVFFYLYFHRFLFNRGMLYRLMISLFIGMISGALLYFVQPLLPKSNSNIITAFFNASLTEELWRFIILFLIIRKSSEEFTVAEGTFEGILLGLGFSLSENIIFSAEHSSYIITLRCLSSVPIHVFSAGIMGFFLSYRSLCSLKKRKLKFLFLALLIPFIYHGLFDYFLFRANNYTYLVPILLAFGFILMEVLISRAALIFSKDVLFLTGHDADNMEVIIRQKEYEKWMFDMQLKKEKPRFLFKQTVNIINTIAGIMLISISVFLYWSSISVNSDLFSIINRTQAGRSILLALPTLAGFLFLLGGNINFLYLRDVFFRMPKGSIATVKQKETDDADVLIFEIFSYATFLSGIYWLDYGQTLQLHFSSPFRIEVTGKILWVNSENKNLPIGTLLQIEKENIQFRLLRLFLLFKKLKRGLGLILATKKLR